MRKPITTGFWQGRLPHWEVEDGRYFVTIHVSGAIPRQAMERIRRQAAVLASPSLHGPSDRDLHVLRTVFRHMEAWLDRSVSRTDLIECGVAEMLVEAIQHRVNCGEWCVYAFTIMPNHLHMFLSVLQGTLKLSLEQFKRWTGHRAAVLLRKPNQRFWQDEWFDHWSRSDQQDERIVRYIERNPESAGLVSSARDWKYTGTFQ